MHRPLIYLSRLLGNDSLGRALGCACAALQALVSVDLVVKIAHLDCICGTLSCAGTAGQALVSNNKSHDVTSVMYLTFRPLHCHCNTYLTKIN